MEHYSSELTASGPQLDAEVSTAGRDHRKTWAEDLCRTIRSTSGERERKRPNSSWAIGTKIAAICVAYTNLPEQDH